MGIAGLPGVSDMGTEPEWHAILKIVIGIVAIIIALMDKGCCDKTDWNKKWQEKHYPLLLIPFFIFLTSFLYNNN